MPKVSIGLPVYNGEDLIRQALDSLLNQEFTDFEIIISDNHSTDNTQHICREYSSRDDRIRYYRQEKNKGASNNFCFVLQKAHGSYFMWAAHDDFWEKEYLQNCVDTLDSNIHAGFVFPSFRLKSIKFGLKKKMSMSLFNFVESNSKKNRVLGFANLHHSSHKCNLVYSLFKTDLIRKTFELQDISNDGLMSMVVLSFSQGILMPGYHFTKRYNYFWPHFTPQLLFKICNRIFPSKDNKAFSDAVAVSTRKANVFFPEYGKAFKIIQENYRPNLYLKGHRIHENLQND